MRASTTTVPIEYSQVVHQVRTTLSTTPTARRSGGRGFRDVHETRSRSDQYTLLELVEAIADVTDDEREIVATVIHLLASGQVRLCGTFRDEPVELILAS